MNTSCPVCGKPVDPLRSRHVGVRDGKVVAYCSAEHARDAETKPTKVPVDPPKPRTPASGVPRVTVGLDSGPVIEIIHNESAPVATPARRDLTPLPEKERSGVRIADFEERRQREASQASAGGSKRTLIVGAVILALGGAAFGVYRLTREPAAKPRPPAVVPAPPVAIDAPPAEPAPDPGASVKRALEVLQQNLASESPRVQRVAAAALGRTRDAAAIEVLARALAKETTDIAKLELAYALARAGDQRGRDALVAGLGSGRRDVKLEAARRLAMLGDAKAAPTLLGYLDVTQLRLGAAEQLAYLKEPKAIEALDTIRKDEKASRDEQARATIALGIAGRSDVVPELQALLKDAHFNAFAAPALAQLGDPTARAVLGEQLTVASLRVEAARSLRRLDPTLDAEPLLADLVASLDSKKDTEQVQIAEAILLLAGDVTWSERP